MFKVTLWNAELKIFKGVISDKKNKERLKSNKDEKVLDWLEDVKKLVDDVQEILDEIAIIGKSSQKRSIFASCRNPIADIAFTDTHRIVDASKQLNRLKTKMYSIGLPVSKKSVPCSGPELCKSAGLPNSEAIYGRDVTDESDLGNFSIMPTIGMAGISKPSLARLEYDEEAVEDFKPEDSNVSRISSLILEPVTSKSAIQRI